MSVRRPAMLAILLALSLASAATAQRDSSVTARADTGADRLTCPSTARLASGVRVPVREVIDTVITLAITDRSWTRRDVDVGVALGASGATGAASAPWRACAGAAAHLGTVTAHLHNVNGTIRLHADPGALGALRQSPPDSSRRPPPAVPPRR